MRPEPSPAAPQRCIHSGAEMPGFPASPCPECKPAPAATGERHEYVQHPDDQWGFCNALIGSDPRRFCGQPIDAAVHGGQR